jgi:hypothetical protein
MFRQGAEFVERSEIRKIPKHTRGIYALLQKRRIAGKYDVVYIGMSKRGVQSRLKAHERSAKKAGLWTHFSVYEVWPNITDEEIIELEGMFRAIYRRDSKANRIAVQKGYRSLKKICNNTFDTWKS